MMKLNYLIVSPVKDEARHIALTLESVAAQTCPPLRWVIVDDGSADATASIVEEFATKCPYIQLVRRERGRERQTGVAEVHAFNHGFAEAANLPFDCVVKLDGDLSFEPDYFEKLLEEFEADPKLGIASGVYSERRGDQWVKIPMPGYHAAGASKVVRRQCFEQIGGFVAERGWDTVDEIRAMYAGWETRHLSHLEIKHWKLEGSGMGFWHTGVMHGEIFYRSGGGVLCFSVKLLRRLMQKPAGVAAAALFLGFVRAAIRRAPLLVSKEEAMLYRRLLWSRARAVVAS
jgi:biofilm PGA synthesis N-glycosyltransferase PgaC